MQIEKVRIKGFRNFVDEEIVFAQQTLIIGPKYEDYLKIKNRSVDSDEAWEVYRKLSSIADMIKSGEENVNPEQKFKELGFNEKNCDELENQLQEMVEFFERNYLLNYCKQEGI